MPRQKEQVAEIVTAQKKQPATGRGGKYNFPSAVPPDDPEDARRVLSEVMHWYSEGKSRPETDDEIAERTEYFFAHCIEQGERPTWEKYVLCLGYGKTTVNDWSNGLHCNPSRSDIIKKAKEICSAYDAGMVSEGKMNPVPYIFRAKNYYGMKDQQDLVLTPNTPLGAEQTPDAIQGKYKELPED